MVIPRYSMALAERCQFFCRGTVFMKYIHYIQCRHSHCGILKFRGQMIDATYTDGGQLTTATAHWVPDVLTKDQNSLDLAHFITKIMYSQLEAELIPT